MNRYPLSIIQEARLLRALGNTYGEINTSLHKKIPKSTLNEWCKSIALPDNYIKRIQELNVVNRNKGRMIALEMNRIKKEEFRKKLFSKNLLIATDIVNHNTAMIALAMLCLGEASKFNPKTNNSFYFGNSNYVIITIFLQLLKECFQIDPEKLRCTVQCRADQDTSELVRYWSTITQVPQRLFYKPLIDPRTIGKPTKKKDYKGVLRIDYFDNKVRLELESLAALVYNQLIQKGPEV